MISLALTAEVSVSDAGVHEKNIGSGTATLITSNKEIEDVIKIVKSLEEFGLLLKDVSKAIENEVKELKHRSLSTLLGTLGASLLENLLAH